MFFSRATRTDRRDDTKERIGITSTFSVSIPPLKHRFCFRNEQKAYVKEEGVPRWKAIWLDNRITESMSHYECAILLVYTGVWSYKNDFLLESQNKTKKELEFEN
jgi:hypothetical protein